MPIRKKSDSTLPPSRQTLCLDYEEQLWGSGVELVAGVDEAGRGPLAGPVVAAAVVLHPDRIPSGVNDSKKLSAGERERLYSEILLSAVGVGIGAVEPGTIDEINILRASMKAMEIAVAALPFAPHHLLIDGPRYDGRSIPFTAIVGGDAISPSIAAASIMAKVTRDRIMLACDAQYPVYGFARHKGYGTPEHLDALRAHGLCPLHRRSFRMPGNDRA